MPDPVERIPDPPNPRIGRPAGPPRRKSKRDAVIHMMPPRYQQFLNGELDVSEMDMEELERGQLRDLNGHFSSTPPVAVPLVFYNAIREEYARRIKLYHRDAVHESYVTLRDVLRDRKSAIARVNAAKELLDRLDGIPTQKVDVHAEVSVQAPWEELLEGGVVVIDIEPSQESLQITNVQDAEVEEDDAVRE